MTPLETDTVPYLTAEQQADTAHRRAAREHAERYAPTIGNMLRDMPISAGSPAEVHAALDLLGAALGEVRDARDAPESPAFLYGAACASLSRVLLLFLLEHEPEDPHRAAVLFITYAAAQRDHMAEGTPEARSFLEGADAGTLTPETAGAALNSFPSLHALTCFLGAHHAFSLAVEALADPADTRSRERLREALAVMRREVRQVTPSRAEA
ncbi:hypothetical protein F8S09_14180 [Deinococcus sp. SDU3-2]|uniref:Uncharacterized protein n=1 Tax=Deinococcus terrestris TaxID=2651870 RepID=A0A7X1NXV5_9DEIO|nr:hypothetical protein [Deinococcus terrestris]MPY67816.1 hypothetical protein [Deinococcus terrestris]